MPVNQLVVGSAKLADGVDRRELLALLAAFFILRPALARLLQSTRDGNVHWSSMTAPASYVIGSVASYWMIDRIAGFWA